MTLDELEAEFERKRNKTPLPESCCTTPQPVTKSNLVLPGVEPEADYPRTAWVNGGRGLQMMVITEDGRMTPVEDWFNESFTGMFD